MYTIKIKNGKATKTSWDSDIREYVTKAIESLVPYLDYPVEIEDTTFGQFFAFIEKDLDFYNVAYRSATYGHPINPFVDEIKKPGKPLDMDYVEIYWGVDIDEGVISDYPCFHGWGDWPAETAMNPPPDSDVKTEGNNEGCVTAQGITKGGIAIEFTPLCDYKDAPLKLDPDFQVHSEDLKTLLFRSKKAYRVHDVIRAILFEITWAGDISKGREAPFDKDTAFEGLKS